MDTINPDTDEITGIVRLGTIRRNNRNLHIRHDADEASGIRFEFTAVDGNESNELGAVIIPATGGPIRRWLPAAHDIGIRQYNLVDGGIIKCLKALARSITEGNFLPADHGFVKDPACRYDFEVEDLEVWRS